jgi:predicted ribosomally synthesized peptide with SipW-like signal peptide
VKKILILIISIGLVFGLVGIGTHAYFSDVETSSGNVFSAGIWDNPKAITAFSFLEGSGIVNETAYTIAVTVPSGTDVSALVPTIAITGASVDPASGEPTDFSSPVTYTVTALDGTTQIYTVTVIVQASDLTALKAITAFSFSEGSGIVNETAYTIAVTVPSGTDVSALVPTIAITGASVDPASGVPTDFSSPVTYTVTAADSSTQAYIVTVTVNN